MGKSLEWCLPNGASGKIECIFVTELGYMMIKMRTEDNTFINYNMGCVKNILEKEGITYKDEKDKTLQEV